MEPEPGKAAGTESTKRKRAKAKPAANEEDLGVKKQEDVRHTSREYYNGS